MAETDDNEMGEKPDVRNFRDRFFQDFFGIAEASRGVLHHVPPDKLVEQALWNEMELVRGSWIAPNLKWRANDLFWRVPLKNGENVYFYLLWEHQTQAERWIGLRLLVYMALAWWSMMKGDESKPKRNLPVILPVVIYQGEEEWTAGNLFSELIDWLPFLDEDLRKELKKKMPEFEFEVIRLMEIPDADLPAELLSRMGLTLMQAVTRDQPLDWFHAHATDVNALLQREDGEAIFVTILHYVGYAMHGQECGDQLEETVKSVTEPELEKKTMNAIEQWELRGVKRNQIKVVQNMLSEGLEADAICRIAGVDADFVGKVQSGELTTENSAAKKGS